MASTGGRALTAVMSIALVLFLWNWWRDDDAPAAPPPSAPLVVERPEGRPMRVLFAGDSLTGGLFADTKADGFVPLVTQHLETGGPVAPIIGEQAGAGLAVVSGLVDVPDDLDLAVIELGTNDVTVETPLDRFRQDYTALLRKVRRENPGVPVLCLGVWWQRGDGGMEWYDHIISETCREAGAGFVPLSGLVSDSKNRGPAGRDTFGGVSDNGHPNNRGHRAIADLVLGSLDVTP